jgi:hypothetical protein
MSKGDVLFILLVCGIIWGIMALVHRARQRSSHSSTEKSGPEA